MKNWKKKLLSELDDRIPELREDVKNAPIRVASFTADEIPDARAKKEEKKESGGFASLFGKFGFRIGAVAAAVLLLCTTAIGIVVGTKKAPVSAVYAYSIEINPSALFLTDENGVVSGARAVNSDADVVFASAGEESFLGQPLSVAMTKFTDEAAELGYFDYKNGAVRLGKTETDGSDRIGNASEALKTAFREKGIYAVVAERTMPLKELGETLGVSGDDPLKEYADRIGETVDFFGARLFDAADYAKTYVDYVINDRLFGIVKLDLERVEKKAEMLSRMVVLNKSIEESADNPCVGLIRDYWTVKWRESVSLSVRSSSEFAEMMKEMDDLVAGYKERFGDVISSSSDLAVKESFYAFLTEDEVSGFIRDLTSFDFVSTAENAIAILKKAGIDVDILESLLLIPSTAEEYYEKMKSAFGEVSAVRKENFRYLYDAIRNPISEGAYEEYVNDIIKKYGDLSAYWESLKK